MKPPFESKIRKSLELNKKDLSHINGTRLYFNKLKNIFWLIVLVALLACSGFAIFTFDKVFLRLIYFGMLIFLLFQIRSVLAKIILRNPLAIVNSDGLYYLFTDETYDLCELELENEIDRKSLMMTLNILDLENKVVHRHAHWNLTNLTNFESKLRYYKILLKRKQVGL